MKNIFLLAAIAFATSGFAQKINGKLSFQKGQKLEVVTESKKTSSMEVMGQAMETNMNSTFTEIYDVQDASAAGATLEHKVKRLVFTADGMGHSQSFDSEKEEDRKGDIGKALDKKLLKNKYIATVDPVGKITAVKADEENQQGKKTDDEMASMMAQQLGMNLMLPKIGDAIAFKILPEKEVSVGDAWADSSATEGTKIKKMFRVANINDSVIVLDFTTNTKIEKTQQMMGVDATINANDRAAGKITIDRKTGLLKFITANTQTEGSVEAQGMTIPINAKTSLTTTVKAS